MQPDDFKEYLAAKKYAESDMKNAAHALLSGIGLLYIRHGKSIVDVVELVSPFCS